MNLKTVVIKYENAQSLEKEIALEIACFRASGGEALVFSLENLDNSTQFKNASVKIMKKLKRQRIVQAFILGEEISQVKTETQYLLNKFPTLPGLLEGIDCAVCVKL